MGQFEEALKRVGNTAFTRARWLLNCLRMGAGDTIVPDEMDRLIWEWGIFLGQPHTALPLEESQGRDLQSRARKAIKELVHGKGWRALIVESHRLKPEGSIGLVVCREIEKDCQFEWELVSLLCQVKNHLRRCNRVGCRNVFVRIRRQRFCSEKCSQRDRMGRYRNKKRKVAPLPTAYPPD